MASVRNIFMMSSSELVRERCCAFRTITPYGHLVPLAHRALYAAFDRFPSRKGAGVHIGHFARALFDWAGGGMLYALGGDDLPGWQVEGDVEIVRFSAKIDNFLERTIAFGERLAALLDEMRSEERRVGKECGSRERR